MRLLASLAEKQSIQEEYANMKVHGRCHCGAVSFSAEVEPQSVMVCHCTDCQTLSGAPLRAIVPACLEGFEVQGTVKSYVKVADSGRKRAQVFCPECGTQLWSSAERDIDTVILRAGCLVQRDMLRPRLQIWRKSAVGWVNDLASVPATIEQSGVLLPVGTEADVRAGGVSVHEPY